MPVKYNHIIKGNLSVEYIVGSVYNTLDPLIKDRPNLVRREYLWWQHPITKEEVAKYCARVSNAQGQPDVLSVTHSSKQPDIVEVTSTELTLEQIKGVLLNET